MPQVIGVFVVCISLLKRETVVKKPSAETGKIQTDGGGGTQMMKSSDGEEVFIYTTGRCQYPQGGMFGRIKVSVFIVR